MDTPKNKFRTPQGKPLLQRLFFETTLADKATVVYTLKENDHNGYPSLKRLYLETKAPTEYSFAMTYLSDWGQWEALCNCKWFHPHLARWRRELELLIKSSALVNIMGEAENTLGKNHFIANKYLLERGWVPKEHQVRGRPSKQDIKDAATEMAREQERVDDDFERLLN